mgnify:CR=1 FL=1
MCLLTVQMPPSLCHPVLLAVAYQPQCRFIHTPPHPWATLYFLLQDLCDLVLLKLEKLLVLSVVMCSLTTQTPPSLCSHLLLASTVHSQDLCDLVLPGLEKLSVVELVDVAAGLADAGFFPGRSCWCWLLGTAYLLLVRALL